MDKYDLIVVGTGFASSFFLLRYLERRPQAKVLVLERGKLETHAWKIENRHLMDIHGITSGTSYEKTFENATPQKPWIYTPSVGGSSNCWYGCTPRFMPNDFKLHSQYGVGTDWPISYDELESFYCETEAVMAIAGTSTHTPMPRSKPFPQPAHTTNEVDRLFMGAYPDSYFVQPCARPTRATAKRARCCASGVCNLCPINAKFTILNELFYLYEQPHVTLQTESVVRALRIENGICRGVFFEQGGREVEAHGELVALGSNPIFNAHILLSSGIDHPWLGRGLCEQIAFSCSLELDGVNNFSGSTVATGYGYMNYDGDHRKERAACLVENLNAPPRIRVARGKYRQSAFLKFIFEDLPSEKNTVSLSADPLLPKIAFQGYSSYVQRGIDYIKNNLDTLLKPLPVEHIEIHDVHPTEGHILGTARMGSDPKDSVVDRNQVLHNVRNVLSLGGSSFPSIAPANPTLTISALSLKTASAIL